MNQDLAFYAIRTVPGFPLGQPEDGRPRYGMTPEMALTYNWLVKHRPNARPFGINFRELGLRMLTSEGSMFKRVQSLVERGWLEIAEQRPGASTYRFVHPVMTFRGPRNG
jgi:hypothetical protein